MPDKRKKMAKRQPAERSTKHKSDRPAERDQPGTGQRGDEVITPAAIREAQERIDEAIEAREIKPPLPAEVVESDLPPEPEPAERAARHAEEQTDHAGLEE